MPGSLSTFAGSLGLALALTPVAIIIARTLGMLDRPDKHLKKHRRPVPYLGGGAIYVACIGAILLVKFALTGSPRGVGGIVLGGTAVFLLGLWDDFKPLSPRTKLVFQILAAGIPIWFGVHIKFIDNPWGAIPLTMLWIVGVTNAFNLLDIMDGLCAGIAVIAALCFWLISEQNGRLNDALIAAALAGSALGFLWYNRPPARVFMGDAGSMFLGYMLAAVAIGEGYSVNTNLGVIAPLLILGFPIFETLFVMAVRWQQHKPVLQGSPDHIPLRLLRMGYTRARVLALLYGVSAVSCVLAYQIIFLNWERTILIGIGASVLAVMSAIRLASVHMPKP